MLNAENKRNVKLTNSNLDLLTYLHAYEPDELVHFSGDVYTTRTHDSLKISNGKWCWWSRGIGGRSALDYLIRVRGLPLPEAVNRINGQVAYIPPAHLTRQTAIEEKHLLLPERNGNDDRVIAYLVGRGISSGIIKFCIRTGRLYESNEYHTRFTFKKSEAVSPTVVQRTLIIQKKMVTSGTLLNKRLV